MPTSMRSVTLFTDEYLQNSHEVLALLRAEGPVHRARTANGLHVWVVTRYDDAVAALTDERLLKNPEGLTAAIRDNLDDPDRGLTFSGDIAHHLLNSDGAEHARVRGVLAGAFTGERIERMRPRITAIADELLDAMAGKRRVDLVDEYALLLPGSVLCELLGVPHQDRDRFRTWSNIILAATDPDAIRDASIALAAFLVQLIRGKQVAPGEDLISELVGAGGLTEAELISIAFLLLVVGHETSGNLIANGVLSLLRDPGQLAALRADPSLLPKAVEELLRFESPVAMTTLRYAGEPVVIGGVDIPRGEIVIVALNSANRDSARFPDADRLDLTRDADGHLAFGHGVHRCLGAALARLTGVVAIGRLLDRFPGLRLDARDGEIRWRRSTFMHGLHALPVAPG
ncbi:cytochrome P450 [Allokutzneria sp. A3M-2-11 16]|uniref:cytochrome P450 family protein n=1 Tax=Allokutzneria sp. A3M-2-11 16 TaxID=2962043 RepID=UPI0020B7EDED|nr:cytochrome P450 [Allokutzneria sp. A3M-2-11 16]MCP3797732.1 cytochrome P450 [Allokutzneria sp. A3M-2-11 16]